MKKIPTWVWFLVWIAPLCWLLWVHNEWLYKEVEKLPVVDKDNRVVEEKIEPDERERVRKIIEKSYTGLPKVVAKLEPHYFNLAPYYFFDEQLEAMVAHDRKFDERLTKNYLREFKTSVGIFNVVSSNERWSINPKAGNEGGYRWATIQLPGGRWLKDVIDIRRTFEADGTLYLICKHHVFRWIGNAKLECLVTFEGLDNSLGTAIKIRGSYISPTATRDGSLGGRYFPVNKYKGDGFSAAGSGFGGLLEYAYDEKWQFYPYEGDCSSDMVSYEAGLSNSYLVLTFLNDKVLYFNPGAQNPFTDK